MKKILLYTDTVQIGGAELQMLLLAKFINKSEFMPILACGNHKQLDNWCEKFKKEEISVIRLEISSKHDLKQYSLLKEIIEQEKIDLLHIHVWNPASGRLGFLAGKSTKTPIITTEHDPFKLSLVKNIFKKHTLKSVKKIITVSKNNAQILKKLYPKHNQKISVIHNGIDTTWWKSQLLRFTENDLKEIKEKVFHAKKDTLIIATIAELHERKGLKYLIKAMPELVKKFPNVKLIIIGEGPQRKELEQLVKKLDMQANIELLGRQNDIPFLLKSSNIFALPSRREAFGLVNAEAMICGLPVVATKVGGIPEIVADEKTGILVKPEDEKELEQALETLIKSSDKRERMGTAGHELVLKEFDAKKMAEEYEKIYKKEISS